MNKYKIPITVEELIIHGDFNKEQLKAINMSITKTILQLQIVEEMRMTQMAKPRKWWEIF